MFLLEYHDREGGGCPGRLKKKNLPRVISEIPGLPWPGDDFQRHRLVNFPSVNIAKQCGIDLLQMV